jgi:hypothetical protein
MCEPPAADAHGLRVGRKRLRGVKRIGAQQHSVSTTQRKTKRKADSIRQNLQLLAWEYLAHKRTIRQSVDLVVERPSTTVIAGAAMAIWVGDVKQPVPACDAVAEEHELAVRGY